MAERDADRAREVTITVLYDDGSRIEYDMTQARLWDYSVLETLDDAATTRRVFDRFNEEGYMP